MMQFMPVLAMGFVAAYGFTPLTKRLALHLDIVDRPNQRKIHREPIPLLGGLAIYLAFVLAVLLFTPADYLLEFGAVVAGSLWLALVGYYDDRYGMQPLTKFSAQIIAGAVLILAGIQIRLFNLPLLDYALTIFWVVGITNAANLMDNMDGLLAGIATIAAGAFFVLAATQELILVASLSAALCGATLGFLRYNFNPASTFMGDTGSLVLGFILAVIGVKLDFRAQVPQVTWIIPLLVLAIPIFDTTLVTVTRLREGRSPFQGGKDHTSHRIASMGFSHRRTVVILYGIAVILGGLAFILSQASVNLALALIVGIWIFAVTSFMMLESQYNKHSKGIRKS